MLRLHHRSARIVLPAGRMQDWLELTDQQLHHLAPGGEVALDLSQISAFDIDELAALGELQAHLRTRGYGMAVHGLQTQPLALLARLGLTRLLGVRRTRRQEPPGARLFQRVLSF